MHEIGHLPAFVVRELVVGIGIVRIPLVQIPLEKVVANRFRGDTGPMLSDNGSIT